MKSRSMFPLFLGVIVGLAWFLGAPMHGPSQAQADFTAAPTNWLSGWSQANGTCSVPVATFATLTAAEADGATGDVRQIAYAICEHLYDTYTDMPSTNRPSQMVIERQIAGATDGSLTYFYGISFRMAVTADIAAE